jgi:hypothetical protein
MRAFLFIFCVIILLGCDLTSSETAFEPSKEPFIEKWYNGHTAAISITYDSGWPISGHDKQAQQLVLSYGLVMDYEVVSYQMPDYIWDYIRDELIPNGFGTFGHGHKHINHDNLTYEEALESFSVNYTLMKERLGITPVSYAYPGGYGFNDSTTAALQNAGFISARMHHTNDHSDPYNLSGNKTEPDHWYRLRALVMQDVDFENNHYAVNNTEELIPYLDGALNNRAWLIKAYHAIGDPNGWGFYKMDEFENGLIEIKNRDFWVASMDNITKYITQRSSTILDVDYSKAYDGLITLQLTHDLDMALFNHEMTLWVPVPNQYKGKEITVTRNGEFILTRTTTDGVLQVNLVPSDFSYEITIGN